MARVKVKRTNPSLEIEVDDELVLKLFTDMALCQSSLNLLWKVTLAGMTSGFGLLTTLVVIL